MNKIIIPVIIVAALAVGIGTYVVYTQQGGPAAPSTQGNQNNSNTSPRPCTLEAKQCPDGSYVGRGGPNCEFSPCPQEPSSSQTGEFGKAATFTINQKMIFSDGLTVTLLEINDSRCKQGVVCIWAGELAPRFQITGGNAGKSLKEVRLGSTTAKTVTENGYTFTYQDATPTTATIKVTMAEVPQTESGISGTVLLGPTCPVEKNPPDPQCADKPYATNLVVTTADQTTVIKEFSSNERGEFKVAVPAGEYAIRSATAANIRPYCSSQGTITVKAGVYATENVSCDTGIR